MTIEPDWHRVRGGGDPSMSTKNATLYYTDFYAWANEQAALLRAGRLSEADIENIAEEIESIGKSQKRELISRLTVLLMHLLKWRYQSGLRGRSWRLTIEQQRLGLEDHMGENPSLKSQLDEAMTKAYRHARIEAEGETHLPRSTFPLTCPFTFEEAMNPDFWPD
jgi:Domain of unknown function DUF29